MFMTRRRVPTSLWSVMESWDAQWRSIGQSQCHATLPGSGLTEPTLLMRSLHVLDSYEEGTQGESSVRIYHCIGSGVGSGTRRWWGGFSKLTMPSPSIVTTR